MRNPPPSAGKMEVITMAKQEPVVYTVKGLSDVLGITQDQAAELMKRDTFPATETAPGVYVVTPENLSRWATKNARQVDGVNKEILLDLF